MERVTELIFLGTGTSSSLPHVSCLTASSDELQRCQTCLSTLTPQGKKNIRRNTSAALRIRAADGRLVYAKFLPFRAQLYLGDFRTIVIDVGKNFQAAAVEWFPKYGLRKIDALLLTHAHADGTSILCYLSVLELISLLSYQRSGRSTRYYWVRLSISFSVAPLVGWTLRGAIQPHIDVYLSQETFAGAQRSFPYLVSKQFASGGGDVGILVFPES